MKRTAIILAGVATLGVLAYIGSRLQADPGNGLQQANATAPTAARPKVAVINLALAIKKYQKWATFEAEYKQYYKRWEELFEKKKAEGVKIKADMDKLPAGDSGREAYEKKLKELERAITDMGEDAKKALSKYQGEQAVQIYKEVEAAVAAYARNNDIEVVLQYSDAVAPAELYHPVNIQRKLQGACMPMYMAGGVDITDVVASMLNTRLAGGAPTNH